MNNKHSNNKHGEPGKKHNTSMSKDSTDAKKSCQSLDTEIYSSKLGDLSLKL